MDSLNTSSEVSISSVQIKEEPLDSEPEPEDFINPAENVKVELEEEDGVKLETNATIDPLANVQAHYTVEASSSEPGCSRKRPAPTTSGHAENEDMDVITKHFKGYDQLEFIPRNRNLQSVRKGTVLRLMRRYVCTECDFTTCYKNNMLNHKRKGLEGYFKCEICEYSGINKADLMIHMKTNHPEPYRCDLCNYSSSCKTGIKSHKKRLHSTNTLACSLCNFKTKCQSYLLVHIRSKHPKANPYSCDSCDQSFPSYHSLGKHKRKEHDTEVYFCNLCDYSCKHGDVLKSHEKKAHANFILDTINSNIFI